MSEMDKTMVRLLVRGFTIMSQLMYGFETPKGVDDIVTFAARNLERITESDDPKTWEGSRVKKNMPMDSLSNLATELHWMAMKFNVHLNAYRYSLGLRKIDFERNAIIYDIEIEEGKKDINDKRA